MLRTYLDCFAVSARIVGNPSLIGLGKSCSSSARNLAPSAT